MREQLDFTDDGIPIMDEHVLARGHEEGSRAWIYQSVFMKRIQSL